MRLLDVTPSNVIIGVCAMAAAAMLLCVAACTPLAEFNDVGRFAPVGSAIPGTGGGGFSPQTTPALDGEFGATQGGVQDMGLARELIANERVPPPEAFRVEGMFSEHDLGLSGAACERVLCLRGAGGVAPTLAGDAAGWVQVGMSSTIDPETFERPNLTIIATVDVSGSMGWSYGSGESEYPTPGAVSRKLLHALADELGPADRMAIVIYASEAETVLPVTSGDDHETIEQAIDGLRTGGSTNMEAGLRIAYELAREAEDTAERRIMLFTDVQPNVGATGATDFQQMADEGAAYGTSLTVFAMGVGLRQEVLNAISTLRGGNAFSLFDFDDVDALLADSWPWMVSPIAYDLALDLTPAEGYQITAAYGFPGSAGAGAGFEVSTVFLSQRKGALLLQVAPTEGVDLAGLAVDGRLTYSTPGGEQVEEDIVVTYAGQALDLDGQYFEQPGTRKAVALAVLVDGMQRAASAYGTDQPAAVEIMQAVVARCSADLEALGDDALLAELELARDLLHLMEQGAEQGDMYGIGVTGG
ncbi:MAG: VWA domain-containing protein [Planctomycetes bacterium]|nr:VWA domain-containing protein [Planctomycetota bacterium]